jgi:predicted TIM-barrel fold metal-dependent hydrolase
MRKENSMNSKCNISRRRFLKYTGASLAASSVFTHPEPAISASATIPVIDTHTHFYDPTRPQGVPWPPMTDPLYKPHLPEHFRALTEKLGVVGTVVVEASSLIRDNQWILDLAKENPVIVGFIGNLELGKPEFAGHLERFSVNPIFRGLRLHGVTLTRNLSHRAFKDDLRRLDDRQLTLDLVGDTQMLPAIERLAKLVPGLRIVIDHLPFRNWDGDVTEVRRALTRIAEMPNVYAKISDVMRRVDGRIMEDVEFYRSVLDVLWELFGPDRAMFGSNWPVCDRIAPYSSVVKVVAEYFSTKEQSEAEKFFNTNSQAAYQWKPRSKAPVHIDLEKGRNE